MRGTIFAKATLAAFAMSVAAGLCAAGDEDIFGRFAKAISAATAAIEDEFYELAEKRLDHLLQRDDLSNAARRKAVLLLAESLFEQKKYEDVSALLKPGSDRLSGLEDEGGFTYWRCLALYGEGRASSAVQALEQFMNQRPVNPFAARMTRLRARCYQKLNRIEEALSVYSEYTSAYTNSPFYPAVVLEYGRALVSADRKEDAVEVLSSLLDGANESVATDVLSAARHTLGRALYDSGRQADGIAVMTDLGLNESVDADTRARAWYSAAVMHEGLTNQSLAVAAVTNGLSVAESAPMINNGNYSLGRLLLQIGDLDRAIAALKKFVAAAPDDPLAGPAQMKIAESLLAEGRDESAEAEFKIYLESFTNRAGQAQAHCSRGWALANLGRYAEAAASFEKAFGMARGREEKERCLFKAADSYFQNEQYKLARAAYERFLEEYPESNLSPKANFQIAECMVRDGEITGAEQRLRDYLDTAPEGVAAEEALFRLAGIEMILGNWKKAIEYYNRQMSAHMGGDFYALALSGRALANYNIFLFGNALSDFETVVRDYPESEAAERAFYMRGMCHYWMGDDEGALSIAREFLRKYRDSAWGPEVLFWMARFTYNQGNYDESGNAFLDFAGKYPDHELTADALLWAGRSAAGRKDYLKAVDIFSRLAKNYPQSEVMAEARFAQANALSELARYAEAILIFEEVITKFPDSGLVNVAWGRKADCQFMLGGDDPARYSESMESYRILANSSTAPLDLVLQAEYKIGRCLERLDLTKEAFEQYYLRVIARYLDESEKGIWHTEGSKTWFTRAAFSAADILESQGDWRRLVNILQRVVEAGVPAAAEAQDRIAKVKSEKWWYFY